MNTILKKHSILTIIIYVIIYASYCFITWSIVNPFQWIINISTYSDSRRFEILFGILYYHCISILLLHEGCKIKKAKHCINKNNKNYE